jgi:hypothetical protein
MLSDKLFGKLRLFRQELSESFHTVFVLYITIAWDTTNSYDTKSAWDTTIAWDQIISGDYTFACDTTIT